MKLVAIIKKLRSAIKIRQKVVKIQRFVMRCAKGFDNASNSTTIHTASYSFVRLIRNRNLSWDEFFEALASNHPREHHFKVL